MCENIRNKKQFIDKMINFICDNPKNVFGKIERRELLMIPGLLETAISDINCLIDLFIINGKERIILATHLGNESKISILSYDVINYKSHNPVHLTFYDYKFAKFIHNKRVNLYDNDLIDCIF